MKLVKKFVVAVVFVSALAVPTLAGDMETPGHASPPPPPDHLLSTTATTDETAPVVVDETTADILYEACTALLGLY
jgi:hypothetical protein